MSSWSDLHAELPVFPCSVDSLATPLQSYLQHYGLKKVVEETGATLALGHQELGGYRIHRSCWTPIGEVKANLFVVTGYTDHLALYGPLYQLALSQGFRIHSFDLPGHGLSSGERAAIDSFETYQRLMDELFATITREFREPWLAIGLSTGGGLLLQRLLTQAEFRNTFIGVSALAPLLYIRRFEQVRRLYWLLRPFLRRVKRVFMPVSHDEAFNQFLETCDPLQPHYLSVRWVGAMYRWHRQMLDAPSQNYPVQIIQGTADETVDGVRNLQCFESLFPKAQVDRVEGARHHLINEALPWRSVMESYLLAYWQRQLKKVALIDE
ncbi:alpha/beta hydrolase [Pokkaliibacter sp. CJK22405]|uniref:alpha/beta hydrolase n=1 Tax=Pokkaliibacter sp. CJK22405 TaxID=3384615 RepID=UPI003985686D